MFVFAANRAEAARVLAFAGVMGDDGAFGVRRAFDFEQVRAAAAVVGLVRLAQHQSFAALLFDGFQRAGDVFAVFDRGLRDHADARLRVFAQPGFKGGEALVEVARGLRDVEDVQVDAAPVTIRGAHGGGGGFKLAAAAIEFAVQRPRRVVGEESGGRAEGVTGAADELLAVPVSAHAVEFFAHRPAAGVLSLPGFGKDEVGRGEGRAEKEEREEEGEGGGFHVVGWWRGCCGVPGMMSCGTTTVHFSILSG